MSCSFSEALGHVENRREAAIDALGEGDPVRLRLALEDRRHLGLDHIARLVPASALVRQVGSPDALAEGVPELVLERAQAHVARILRLVDAVAREAA